MSRVYFHSPSGDAELRGSERAYLGGLVDNLAIGLLGLSDPWTAERLAELVNPAETTLRNVPKGYGYGEWRSRFGARFTHGLTGPTGHGWRTSCKPASTRGSTGEKRRAGKT